MAFNASLSQSNLSTTIHCVNTQEDLQALVLEVSLTVAFDFDDPNSLLPGTNKSVSYHIRPSFNLFSITNWVNYANSTHQAPNAMAGSLASIFAPLQQFMDSLILLLKNASPTFNQYVYRQFPTLDYYQDTRVTVHFLFISIMFSPFPEFFLPTYAW